jgi:hypothetical protein
MFDIHSMTAIPLPAQIRPDARPRAAWATALLGVLVVAALLPRVGFLARPFESDAGLYIYMGKVVAGGGTLYREFYETKPPGVALLTAGLYRAFGAHWWPYMLLQTAMAIAAAGLLARAARRQVGEAAELPTLLFALVFLNFSPTAYRGFQLETVQTFFACVGAYFGLRAIERERGGWDWFWMGLFAGIAAMLKPTAGAVAGAFVVAMLVRRTGIIRAAFLIMLGALIAPALVFLWTWRAGLLGEMPELLREISLYGRGVPLVREDLLKPVCVMVIGGFAFLIARVFRRDVSAEEHGPQAGRLNEFVLFSAAWLVLECFGVFVQKRMYAYHFFPLTAPLALLFGAYCRRGRRHVAYVSALGPIVAMSLVLSISDFRSLLTTGPATLPQSDYLRAHAAPGDRVVGDGIERVLMETGLACGSRYAHLFYFANHDAAPLEYGQRFLDDLDAIRPAWAVFETHRAAHHRRQLDEVPMYAHRPTRRANFLATWERIDAYLAAHYGAVAQAGGVTIYRRR